MRESSSSLVELHQLDSPTLEALLKFIYCKLQEVPLDLAARLFIAADAYGTLTPLCDHLLVLAQWTLF